MRTVRTAAEALLGGLAILVFSQCVFAQQTAPTIPTPTDDATFCEDIKPVTQRIDRFEYAAARSREVLLKLKYPELMEMKLANLDRIQSLRKGCMERINKGAVKLSMGDISRRYERAGDITQADETGLVGLHQKKTWDSFTKKEIADLYRKVVGDETAENALGLAAFLIEGTFGEQEYQDALDFLGKAARHGEDVSRFLSYAEIARKYMAPQTTAGGKEQKTQGNREAEGKSKASAGNPGMKKPGPYDEVYVTTAATGEKIPHPLSTKTYKTTYLGKDIEVPEGMVFIPAGRFAMGAGDSQRVVYLDAYFIGKFEVTKAEWKAYLDLTHSSSMPAYWTAREIPAHKDNHPHDLVTWEDAHLYCEWISRETGRAVHLPTEAQWERAARGPKEFDYPWGDKWDDRLCNNSEQWAKHGFPRMSSPSDMQRIQKATHGGCTMPVGSFPRGRSAYGCYDMVGNVCEWCSDWYKADCSSKKAAKNPEGPTEEDADLMRFGNAAYGKTHVVRGGSWAYAHLACCSTYRAWGSLVCPANGALHFYAPYGCGFRIAASLPEGPGNEERKDDGRVNDKASGPSAPTQPNAKDPKPAD